MDSKGNAHEASLDFLRWTSALAVAVYHLARLLIGSAPPVSGLSWALAKVFFLLTSLGNDAVTVFFVISGYLIGGKILLRGIPRDRLFDYFVHRFCRIYIVLLPALLLTLIVDALNGLLSPHKIQPDHSLSTFLCNLANMQGEFCGTFGTNTPLWSLAFEWFYYITFPALIALYPTNRSLFGWLTLLLLIAVLAAVFPNFCFFYPIWAAGALARIAREKAIVPRPVSALGMALFLISALFVRRHGGLGIYTSFLSGAGIALWLAADHSWLRTRFDRGLAAFSYSLYVIHYPLMLLAVSALSVVGIISGPDDLSASILVIYFLILGVVCAMAWIFALATEARTQELRLWLLGLVPSAVRDPAAQNK